ncbi:hypothetical protein C8N46_109144 [Kordia periserrulae]|uniref:DUF1684 domain-containing protein n=1 Tax=Kordia periserrulae TaxID=701523 RepID=A0A2T6BTZ6_9FLAO|nr:DUF1684 domain-containing protein [Kordia periserrulae]PTX59555.1 hypothetical protein C8N46_109144 [Kordia periserrulae]
MKKWCLLISLLILNISCSQEKNQVKGETEFQRELNAEYKDASKSPLKEKDLKTFEGLDFFPVDDTYKVTATFKRTPDSPVFKMPTSTDRKPEYRRYGIATFTLNGKQFSLEIYQNQSLMKEEEYKNYLFLPFTDETNGFSSYGGGRYIDLEIPQGDTIEIDFNKAYNPYCAYNDRYSCPIPPRVNFLQTEINAGVKAFDKH